MGDRPVGLTDFCTPVPSAASLPRIPTGARASTPPPPPPRLLCTLGVGPPASSHLPQPPKTVLLELGSLSSALRTPRASGVHLWSRFPSACVGNRRPGLPRGWGAAPLDREEDSVSFAQLHPQRYASVSSELLNEPELRG